MKFCTKCGAQNEDSAVFCPSCGNPFGSPAVAAVVVPDFDHTAEFDTQDISDNKVFAVLPYLLGVIGIIVALLAIKESKYVAFHVRQALKLTVVNLLLGIIAGVLCFTFIVPIAAGVCMMIVWVLNIIAIFQVFGGKAKEPAIIRNLKFLK